MKKYIIILIVLFGLLSCGSTKKTTMTDKSKTDTEIRKSETVKQVNDSTFVDKTKTIETTQTDKSRDENKTESSIIKNTTIEYDTSKPPDPNTGKPPIKSISNTTHGKNINTQLSEAEKQHIRSEIEKDIRDEYKNKYNAKIDSIAHTKEKNDIKQSEKEKDTKPLKAFVIGFIIPLFVFLIIWLRKRIKSLII